MNLIIIIGTLFGESFLIKIFLRMLQMFIAKYCIFPLFHVIFDFHTLVSNKNGRVKKLIK